MSVCIKLQVTASHYRFEANNFKIETSFLLHLANSLNTNGSTSICLFKANFAKKPDTNFYTPSSLHASRLKYFRKAIKAVKDMGRTP